MIDTPPPKHRRQADRVRETRQTLLDAAVYCLDQHGYAATTISAVQSVSGLSRGALMYHFATRQDLIEATARRLLESAIRPTRHPMPKPLRSSTSVSEQVGFYWRRVVDTQQGRAFIEILVACRTDPDLAQRLTGVFGLYEQEVAVAARATFLSTLGDDDAAQLWDIGRIFLLGLVINATFINDAAKVEEIATRFGALLDTQLQLKSH